MNVIPGTLDGLLIIEPRVFGDSRGFFLETWQRARYAEHGMHLEFTQDNLSFSGRGILRGLHFQNPHAQGKLVQVLQGEVFDVAVDLRRSSPTFGRWEGVVLNSENKRQLYVPPGFAHGFAVVSDSALFYYKCTDLYFPKNENTLLWNDPDLDIPWPLESPLLSDKDRQGVRLKDIPADRLYD